MQNQQPIALTIAGSDSGAGAGVQADLKTFASLGVYGVTAITAITSQNTIGVHDSIELPVSIIESQIDALMSDFQPLAVKTGMLSSAQIVESVVSKIQEHRMGNLIVDPVMIAKGGDRLLNENAVDALIKLLIPLSLIITPNAHEAEVLSHIKIHSLEDAQRAAEVIHNLGARNVVVKGGHFGDDATDVLFDGSEYFTFSTGRVTTSSTHGTGCTFSSAIAAGVASGKSIYESVSIAKKYVYQAISNAVPIGQGYGPLNHLYNRYDHVFE